MRTEITDRITGGAGFNLSIQSTERQVELASNQPMIGICCRFKPEHEMFTYMAAIEKNDDSGIDGMETMEIPALTWAVFTSIGPMPGAIQDVWKHIFQEWFPATGYEHADGPELEVYLPGDGSAADCRCEVWIPIVESS